VNPVTTGRRGPDVRSDMWVELELRDSGGIELAVKSKVDFMYGEANRTLILDVLRALGVAHARVAVEDTGALPMVIAARVEAAVRRALPGKDLPEWLPEPGPSFARPSVRDRWRRSRLYLPGNEPRFMLSARLHAPDAVILDLEDSVPPPDKDAALLLVRNALRALDFGDCERMVRLNQLPRGLDEVEPLVRAGANLLLIPKCEDDDEVEAVAERIEASAGGKDCAVWLMPIIETCRGMFKASKIARASDRVVALTWGLEDYIADLGGVKTAAGLESLWARSQVVNAARAAGVQAIDTVFGDVDDLAALAESCRAARELGFEGKGCIHPRQVAVVNQSFTPTPDEVARAQRIVLAFRDAEARGLGVVTVGSRMVDAPVVKRALRTIELAVVSGCLAADWEAR
jgi:citrate lyase subunit beta/citryl-CoA lyase